MLSAGGAAMRRLLLGVLVALFLTASGAAPDAALAQGDPCSMQASDRWEYADVAGVWERRGMALDIDPRGCGVLSWPTYHSCPPGRTDDCDRLEDGVLRYGGRAGFVLNIHEGASASGYIVDSSDWADLGNRGIVLRLNDDGTLTTEWDDSPLTFCRPWLHDPERCGA
jgi:hypothetical protein